jgi:hypothetical protein
VSEADAIHQRLRQAVRQTQVVPQPTPAGQQPPNPFFGANTPLDPIERVQMSQIITAAARPAAQRRFRPHFARRNLPLSIASANSAQPAPSLTQPGSRENPNALLRVASAIQVARRLREERTDARAVVAGILPSQPQRQPADQDSDSDVPPPWVDSSSDSLPPLIAESPDSNADNPADRRTRQVRLPRTRPEAQIRQREIREQAQMMVVGMMVVPARSPTYAGACAQCAFCLGNREDGQLVSRLACGRVFRGECWLCYAEARPQCPGNSISSYTVNSTRSMPKSSRFPSSHSDMALDQYRQDHDPNHSRRSGSTTCLKKFSDARCCDEISTASRAALEQGLITAPISCPTDDVATCATKCEPRQFRDCQPTSIEDHIDDVLYIKFYRIQTRLADGRPDVLVDAGSVGNLCGDRWAEEVAVAAARRDRRPMCERRQTPLEVSGVAAGSQSCEFDCELPVAFEQADGQTASVGCVAAPTVSNSDLPGLLGLAALRMNRAKLDFSILKLFFCGPGDYDLPRGMPPGADSFQCEIAPSGHLVIPCCEYEGAALDNDHTLTLVSNRRRNDDNGVGGSSSAGLPPRRVPPPPVAPPPATVRAREVGHPPEIDGSQIEVSRLIPARDRPRQRQVVGGSQQAETGLPPGSDSIAVNLIGPYLWQDVTARVTLPLDELSLAHLVAIELASVSLGRFECEVLKLVTNIRNVGPRVLVFVQPSLRKRTQKSFWAHRWNHLANPPFRLRQACSCELGNGAPGCHFAYYVGSSFPFRYELRDEVASLGGGPSNI